MKDKASNLSKTKIKRQSKGKRMQIRRLKQAARKEAIFETPKK
jgi:hypothetical protein